MVCKLVSQVSERVEFLWCTSMFYSTWSPHSHSANAVLPQWALLSKWRVVAKDQAKSMVHTRKNSLASPWIRVNVAEGWPCERQKSSSHLLFLGCEILTERLSSCFSYFWRMQKTLIKMMMEVQITVFLKKHTLQFFQKRFQMTDLNNWILINLSVIESLGLACM
jgi:hypothetical protein